jgi:hypothetical protein
MKENPLRKIHAVGQSIWLDHIRRDLISRGNRAFANMKPTVEARLCSRPHRSRQYGSVDSLQRYGFRSFFCPALHAGLAVEGACGAWLALPGFAGWRDAFSVLRALCRSGPLVSSFRSGEFMKTLLAMAVGTVPLLVTGVSLAENGNRMGGGMWGGGWMGGGGYDGIWLPILLVIVIAGLVAWIVTQKRR